MSKNNKNLYGYITVREFLNIGLPTSVQHLIMKKYCDDNFYQYVLAEQELIIKNSSKTLYSLVNKLKKNSSLVMCSVNMLPNQNLRKKIFKVLLKKKISIHFVFEKFVLKNLKDYRDLEDFLNLNYIISNRDFSSKNFFHNIDVIK